MRHTRGSDRVQPYNWQDLPDSSSASILHSDTDGTSARGSTSIAAGRDRGFILLMLVVLCAIALLGYLVKQIFHIAGLGPIDAIGGVLLSVLKMD